MPVIFENTYSLPAGDQPLDHARISHASGWVTGDVSASSTDPNPIYDAANPANAQLAQTWKPASLPAFWQIDTAAPIEIDHCVVLAPGAGESGATLTVRYHDGVDWVAIMNASGAQLAGGLVMMLFAPVTADRFDIRLDGALLPLSFVRFGTVLQMPTKSRFVGRTPFDLTRQVTVSPAQSVRGTPLSRTIVREGLDLSLTWTHLPESFVTGPLTTLLTDLDNDVIVVADRPGSRPDDVALCWQSGKRPMPAAMGVRAYHEITLGLQGYVAE